MHPYRDDFETFQGLTDCYVEMGDKTRVPVEGKGTVCYGINGFTVRKKNVLYVPDLGVGLLSIRLHRRKKGCSFVADNDAMLLHYPRFTVPVDDKIDTLVPIQSVELRLPADYDETVHTARLAGQAAVIRKQSARAATKRLAHARPVKTRRQTE